jgi:hypothetical protein
MRGVRNFERATIGKQPPIIIDGTATPITAETPVAGKDAGPFPEDFTDDPKKDGIPVILQVQNRRKPKNPQPAQASAPIAETPETVS